MNLTAARLAFNQIGVVEVSEGDPHQVVNVEFHNRSLRTGYHFTDTLRFTMAAIGMCSTIR